MSKRPSNSYLSMLRPYLRDCEKYASRTPNSIQMIEAHRRGSAVAVVNNCTNVANPSGNANSMRAFNFNVNPLWHKHNNPHQRKSHKNFELQLRQRGGQDNKGKQQQQQHQQHGKHKSSLHISTASETTANTAVVPLQISVTKKCECDMRFDERSQHYLVERSLPIFEVLSTSSPDLLYQNSIFVDGINYNYDMDKGNGKLKVNCAEFFKRITANTKPSDRDVIFGNAKVLLSRKGGWEGSRIDWLLELERRQDMRRKQYMQQQQTPPATTLQQLKEYDDDDDNTIFDICCFPCGCQMLIWQMN